MSNKYIKGLIATALAFSMVVVGGVSGTSTDTVYAADFSDEAVVFDVENTGYTEDDGYDSYTINIPSDGILTVKGFANTDHGYFNLYDKYETKIGNYGLGTSSEPGSSKIKVAKGTYKLEITGNDYLWGDGNYYFTCSFNFDSSTNAKVSSPKAGALKVTVPKGSNVDAFQVRYKKAGESKWTEKTVATKKNLNKTFEGLSKGKKYTVQTRKVVKDAYGYEYFSNWTKAQTVTIKK